MLAAAPLTAQQPRVLEGTVIAVQGDRARLEITSSRLPSPGDSVWLGTDIEGVGDVMLEGRWQVSEITGMYAWVEPVGEVASPLPGYGAAIFSDNPMDAPEDAELGVEVLYSRNFAGGATSNESDGPYCRTRNTPAGYLIRTVAESGGCMWNLWGANLLTPPVRISTTINLREGKLSWGYGLRFGTADRSVSRYYVLLVSGAGSYKLTRRDKDGWVNLTGWVAHPAVATGLGARNELTVELEGNTIHYSVNGVHLGSHVEPSPVEGYIGFYLNDPGHELLFENIRVERLDTGTARISAESLLHEDFSDPSRWREDDGPPCRTRNTEEGFSVHNVASSGSCYWSLWYAGEFEPSVRIDVVVALRSGPVNNGYGIKFATSDRQNSDYYAFVVSGDGHYQLGHWNTNQGWTRVAGWTRHDAVNTGVGATNRLTVEVRGDIADLYINNRYVHTFRAPRALGGYLSLFVYAPDIEAVFKDLRVEKLRESR